jgi:hypothetical protein
MGRGGHKQEQHAEAHHGHRAKGRNLADRHR